MIVDCAVYTDGKRHPGDLPVDQALEAAREPDSFVWIGLFEPTTDEFDALMTRLSAGEVTPVEVVQELVESWEADLPFCADSLQKLQAHQPGCLSAIIADYSTAFVVSRKGN